MRTQAYDHNLYQSVARRYAFGATDVQDARKWQTEFRRALRSTLGLDCLQKDLAGHIPEAECGLIEKLDGYTRESWRLTVEPEVQLPFYLLRPDGCGAGTPLVVTPHGHNPPHLYVGLHSSKEEEQFIAEGDRDIAVQAVREGYIALAPTARGFGETRTEEDIKDNRVSSCRIQAMHGLLLGRTAVGERVWDISRLLDWALASLPVDPARVAITGNSGGGTVCVFAGACDERISVVMPGSYFCTFADSIGSIFHCDCNYIPGILRLGEMHDVAGLIAPRPFCAINGVTDPIFPIANTRQAVVSLQQIYQVFGAQDRCRLFEGQGGHRFYAAGAWPFLREFFGKLI